jgi:hypothetical protein
MLNRRSATALYAMALPFLQPSSGKHIVISEALFRKNLFKIHLNQSEHKII